MSLPFLPSPYPDELLYSVFARYHILSQNIALKETMYDLFGRHTASAVVDLPNNLQTVYEKLTPGSLNTPEHLIEHHTLFPLFRPFLDAERSDKVFKAMKYGGDVHTTIGVMASSVSSPSFLRFCPKCVTIDKEQYGEPYWHRTHQVPGVEVCHIHNYRLINSNAETTSKQNKHAFIAIDENIVKNIDFSDNKSEISPIEIAIAESVHWLLNNHTPVLGLQKLKSQYVSELKKMNLSVENFVRQREFIDSFRCFYGDDFLAKLNCSLDYSEQFNWLSYMVRNSRSNAQHPLRHILLMKFFALKEEELFYNKTENYHPFGCGSWLCLNPASEHYRKPMITECKVTRDYKTGEPVGTFECSCGFIYSRRGPDESESDRYKIGRIKQFGHVWEKELIHLIQTEKSTYNAAARKLLCDPTTAKKQFLKLQSKDSSCEGATGNGEFKDERMTRRSKWLHATQANEGLSKTELRQMFKADYTWLYRHDREWLNQNSPELLPRKKYADNRVNWSERDNVIRNKAKRVIHEEFKCSVKPTRITISFIGKQIGELSLLQKHIEKLPKTKALIENHQETVEEFQIRRVKYISSILREQQDVVMEWQIVREAGLRPGYSQRVQRQVEIEIALNY